MKIGSHYTNHLQKWVELYIKELENKVGTQTKLEIINKINNVPHKPKTKDGILHTHIWDNETPNKLYSHSHIRGDIPHGHHGSRYWKVEKIDNFVQVYNPKSKRLVLVDRIKGLITGNSKSGIPNVLKGFIQKKVNIK
jgi:hypothetical protein